MMSAQERAVQQQEAMAQLAEYQAEYAAELTAIKQQHQQAAADMQSQYAAQQHRQTLEHQQALDRLADELSQQQHVLAERQQEHELQLERFHAKALAAGQLHHEEHMHQLRGTQQQELADLISIKVPGL